MKLLAFLERFDHHNYRFLCGAVIRHGHGHHHGGVAAALGQIGARTEILSIGCDHPFPAALTVEMAGKIRSPGRVQTIHLRHGHDGFIWRRAYSAPGFCSCLTLLSLKALLLGCVAKLDGISRHAIDQSFLSGY